MSAPDRPTREDVDAVLWTVDQECTGGGTRAAVLAAEVRALRAELDEQNNELTVRRLRDLVVARTPHPADPADTAKVGDHLGKAWVDAQQTLDEGGCRTVAPGGVWMCTRSGHPNGSQHVSTVGGRVVVAWGPAPLPAVPDGENDEVRCECGHIDTAHRAGPDTGWGTCISCDCAAFQQADENASADGEDVPARLDAAADVLAPFDSSKDSSARQAERHLRRAADWLNATSPAARVAVAAALARPTGGTT